MIKFNCFIDYFSFLVKNKGFILIVDKELKIIKDSFDIQCGDKCFNDYLTEFLLNGSKFIRSILAILYFKAQSIEITEDFYRILVAGELIHSASLLHDDVIDNEEFRRGKTTIAKQFSPKVSILAGDFILSLAIESLLELKQEDVLMSFKNCIRAMSEAELKQFFLRKKIPTEKEYLEICKGKTAKLFSTILENCAKYTNLSLVKAIHFGEFYGICFQIKNDLEKKSAQRDKANDIFTAKDVLGIEKTAFLLDNYKKELFLLIKEFPDNSYKEELRGLIDTL